MGDSEATPLAATITWMLKGRCMLQHVLHMMKFQLQMGQECWEEYCSVGWLRKSYNWDPFFSCGDHMICTPSTDLDCNSKFWRLVADILNDVANFLELLAPLFPSVFLLIVCSASVAKVGVTLNTSVKS